MLKAAGWMGMVLILILLLQGAAAAETGPEKTANIQKLLRLSGIQDQLSYMKDDVMNSYSRMIAMTYPKVPDAFWGEFNTLIGDEEMQALIDKIVPVYDKHMSNEVIGKLIAMFETPFWKEWKEKMPAISREAGMAGQSWVQEHTQTEAFRKRIDALVDKYELEKLNPQEGKPQ